MKLTVQLVIWNDSKYLPLCLQSIYNQTYQDFQVFIIDNASIDNSLDYLKENYPQVGIFRNRQNLQFAKAHNQGLKLLRTDYVLVTNPDIILEENFLQEMMAFAEQHPEAGSFCGKTKKLTWQDQELGISQKTNLIDSLGLRVHKNRHVDENGLGEEDNGQFDKSAEIFGPSAAIALYRHEALEDVKLILPNGRTEYFDEDFIFYKEDIDLAWRLQKAGWKSYYNPRAVAYHFRGSKKTYSDSWKALNAIHSERSKRKKLNNYLSYKNHLLLLAKNETWGTFLPDFLNIIWYEGKKFIYCLLFEITTLKAIISFFKQLPLILTKRKQIKIKVNPVHIRTRWFKK